MKSLRLGSLIVVVFSSWGCGEGYEAFGPVVGSAVDSADAFSLAGSKIEYTATDVYVWSCTSQRAELSVNGTLSQGSFRLEILDGSGAVVHDNTYAASFELSLTAPTRPGGVPGLWTLRLTFANATWSGVIELEEPWDEEIEIEGSYDLSGTLQFQLAGSSGLGTVECAGSPTQGALRIRVWDGQGVLRYDRAISGPSDAAIDEETTWSAAGIWKVRLDFLAAMGGSSIAITPP